MLTSLLKTALCTSLILSFGTANAGGPPSDFLFTNVDIFNGKSDVLLEEHQVLVSGNKIVKIGKNIDKPDTAVIIDGTGKTLMPGIIEAHGHPGSPTTPNKILGDTDWMYIGLSAAADLKTYIDAGWTTVRAVGGGPTYGIQRAVDEGIVPGPRIYPSGMFISQTSGHADFRRFADPHPDDLSEKPFWNKYYGHIADGTAEVRQAVREELRKGAVHIKMMAGGGVTSQYDPLHTTQYSLEEMKAAVEAADDWGAYVMVHAYTDKAVNRALDAGVKVIEHGQLMTEQTAERMAKEDVFLSTQAFAAASDVAGQLMKAEGPKSYGKWQSVNEGFKNSIKYAVKHNVKIAFGTDLWGDATPYITQEFATRQAFFSNYEILRQATSVNGELVALTGVLNPYDEGPLGVIEEGAYADILLVNGNPVEDLTPLIYPEEGIALIMKNGEVYKNKL
ncbi:hypothetical protein RJ45_11575 [Photobacterium gaetbulicola]|uniref:Amidohydrolase-related domain-containing protein n=1 Tax=Photobacterium gaetbulicola TaxID=1295392 RepID=A0A0B9H3I6_9GAMM|nr:amidohydrolase family protein [Photobacterium gaetbulicola]KHT63452.1 hypothetical protein RJ45_11575 [Photobacterium gaetbulicola]